MIIRFRVLLLTLLCTFVFLLKHTTMGSSYSDPPDSSKLPKDGRSVLSEVNSPSEATQDLKEMHERLQHALRRRKSRKHAGKVGNAPKTLDGATSRGEVQRRHVRGNRVGSRQWKGKVGKLAVSAWNRIGRRETDVSNYARIMQTENDVVCCICQSEKKSSRKAPDVLAPTPDAPRKKLCLAEIPNRRYSCRVACAPEYVKFKEKGSASPSSDPNHRTSLRGMMRSLAIQRSDHGTYSHIAHLPCHVLSNVFKVGFENAAANLYHTRFPLKHIDVSHLGDDIDRTSKKVDGRWLDHIVDILKYEVRLLPLNELAGGFFLFSEGTGTASLGRAVPPACYAEHSLDISGQRVDSQERGSSSSKLLSRADDVVEASNIDDAIAQDKLIVTLERKILRLERTKHASHTPTFSVKDAISESDSGGDARWRGDRFFRIARSEHRGDREGRIRALQTHLFHLLEKGHLDERESGGD